MPHQGCSRCQQRRRRLATSTHAETVVETAIDKVACSSVTAPSHSTASPPTAPLRPRHAARVAWHAAAWIHARAGLRPTADHAAAPPASAATPGHADAPAVHAVQPSWQWGNRRMKTGFLWPPDGRQTKMDGASAMPPAATSALGLLFFMPGRQLPTREICDHGLDAGVALHQTLPTVLRTARQDGGSAYQVAPPAWASGWIR